MDEFRFPDLIIIISSYVLTTLFFTLSIMGVKDIIVIMEIKIIKHVFLCNLMVGSNTIMAANGKDNMVPLTAVNSMEINRKKDSMISVNLVEYTLNLFKRYRFIIKSVAERIEYGIGLR